MFVFLPRLKEKVNTVYILQNGRLSKRSCRKLTEEKSYFVYKATFSQAKPQFSWIEEIRFPEYSTQFLELYGKKKIRCFGEIHLIAKFP